MNPSESPVPSGAVLAGVLLTILLLVGLFIWSIPTPPTGPGPWDHELPNPELGYKPAEPAPQEELLEDAPEDEPADPINDLCLPHTFRSLSPAKP